MADPLCGYIVVSFHLSAMLEAVPIVLLNITHSSGGTLELHLITQINIRATPVFKFPRLE